MPVLETPDGPVFPGLWLGRVIEIDKEESGTGRCKVEVLDVYGENIESKDLPWSYPIFPGPIRSNSTDGDGFFYMPSVGANVGVLFERGNPNAPRWFGGWMERGKIPFDFRYNFPHSSVWKGPDGMMIRFVAGQRLQVYVGKSGSFDDEGKFVPDGEHKNWDTVLTLDKKHKKVTFRCKYDIDIRCKGKISVRAPQIRVRIMPNQLYNEDTEEFNNDPDSPKPTRWSLDIFDPEAQKGCRVIAEPGKLTARAREVHGFGNK